MTLKLNNKFLYYLLFRNLKENKNSFCINKLTLITNNIYLRNFKNKNLLFISSNNNKCLSLLKTNYLLLNNFFLNTTITFLKKNYLKANELELKGLNYRFTKLKNKLLLDLGRSHFQLVSYPINTFFFSLKKKKFKKILFINFNNSTFNSTLSFF